MTSFTRLSDIDAIVEKSSLAQQAWAQTSPRHKREIFQACSRNLQKSADALVATMREETGSGAAWAHFNVNASMALLQECAGATTQVTGQTIPSDIPGSVSMTWRAPVGVVLGIAPWNAPLLLGIRAIATPIACGNSAILKASEHSPATHAKILEIFEQSGLPEGVLSYVNNAPGEAPAMVEKLIADPRVRRVNFTGSTATGRIIGRLAGQHLKPALLELGSKAALIVLSDADIAQAVDAAVFGAFMNQGQICMSTERIIVDESIADDFARALQARTRVLAGTRQAPGACFAPLISEQAADHVESLVQEASGKGARLLTDFIREGRNIAPLVIDHVDAGMRLYREESFGPIAPMIRVKGDEEALRVANDSDYGLCASIFGSDIGRVLKLARQINAGLCHINGPTVKSEPQLPFGGTKDSGFGRFGASAAIHEFTELKTITIQTEKVQYPL